MEYDLVKKYVESELVNLSTSLTYHNAWHTLGDVLPSAKRLAKEVGVIGDELILLKTAVLFHDMGYLEQYEDNEIIGARMAQEKLPEYGYSENQIEIVKQMILSTQMPQHPETMLEKILCDADLDSLWREDFFDLSQNLFSELNDHGFTICKKAWREAQIRFLDEHEYCADIDVSIREKGKQNNICLLQTL